jgi:hypothetical protein
MASIKFKKPRKRIVIPTLFAGTVRAKTSAKADGIAEMEKKHSSRTVHMNYLERTALLAANNKRSAEGVKKTAEYIERRNKLNDRVSMADLARKPWLLAHRINSVAGVLSKRTVTIHEGLRCPY